MQHLIEEFEEAAHANGYRTQDAWTEAQYQAAKKALSDALGVGGWLYDNEDTGREYSVDHPIESGNVPDAGNIEQATATALLSELKSSWIAWNDDRTELANLRSRLYDSSHQMADGGDDIAMTACEEVLAYLLIERIGVPDDVGYSPDQAQKIITNRMNDIERENERLRTALLDIQKYYEKHFAEGETAYQAVIVARESMK